MADDIQESGDASAPRQPSHKRTPSGSSILSRFPFMRALSDNTSRQLVEEEIPRPASRAISTLPQQQKTRRRRGSLRKVALLGRGAQRDRKDSKSLAIDTSCTSPESTLSESEGPNGLGLITSYTASGQPVTEYSSRLDSSRPRTNNDPHTSQDTAITYTSTDEEDLLQMSHGAAPMRSGLAISSGSDSYFESRGSAIQRGRSIQQATSPLSYSGLASTPLPPPDSDWDYSETEWWGWVVLTATWFVFVIGMGSCFDVWSWAWDVGKTPYAPPELEDDPTLPIVGYYPALLILTGVMAWVWVVVAWVGMKYFRHAKISGD